MLQVKGRQGGVSELVALSSELPLPYSQKMGGYPFLVKVEVGTLSLCSPQTTRARALSRLLHFASGFTFGIKFPTMVGNVSSLDREGRNTHQSLFLPKHVSTLDPYNLFPVSLLFDTTTNFVSRVVCFH